jgi:endonuclease-3 related protein
VGGFKRHKEILIQIYETLYDAFGPQHWWPGETPFEVAVGAILTQNTNWGNVEKAIDNLKKADALDARTLLSMPPRRLASLIKPAGYFNVKAKRLRNFLSLLGNHYSGSMDVMNQRETEQLRRELLSVNGIGPETADSILLYALERPVFVIDAYTRRVLKRHSIVDEDASYDDLQKLFHSSLSRDVRLFNEYHALFVRVGKEFCKPRPKCDSCPLDHLPEGRKIHRP